MATKLETPPDEYTGIRKCPHYWIIESPKGPTSKGVCKFCGEEREFDSFGPDSWSQWEHGTSTSAEFSGSGLPGPIPSGDQHDS